MKRILATVVVLTLAVPVWGRDYEKDLDAYEQRDEETALSEKLAGSPGRITPPSFTSSAERRGCESDPISLDTELA